MKVYVAIYISAKLSIRYVYARHIPVTNELFTFRSWLVTLGMNGADFKETREILIARLDGCMGYRIPQTKETPWNARKCSGQERRRTPVSKSPLNTSNDPVLMSIMATKPVHAPRSKKAASSQAEPVSVEALHASANVFQNTMAMLLARNMPAAAPAQPVPPPVEATPIPAPVSRHPRDRRLFADYAWEWFESYKVPKLRPGTEMNYRLIIRKHLVPFFGSMRLDEITTVDIQRFYNQHAPSPAQR